MVDTRKTGGQPSENSAVLDEIKSIQKELAEVRRYAESLHAAIYGEAEYFYQQPGNLFHSDRNSDYDQSSDQGQGSGGALRKEKALQEWEHRMEAASDANLVCPLIHCSTHLLSDLSLQLLQTFVHSCPKLNAYRFCHGRQISIVFTEECEFD